MFFKGENRRRKYLVDKKIQWHFTWLLVIHVAVPTMVLGGFLYAVNKMYLSTLQKLVGASTLSDPSIKGILNFSILAIVLFLIVSTVLLIFLGIRFTHHVAGPLYRLERSMDKLMKGEKIEPLHFRKTDIVDRLAEKFNALARKFGQIK